MRLQNLLGEHAHTSPLQTIGESLAGCGAVALLTFAAYELHFKPAPIGFLFLLVVVCVAIFSGFWQASAVSILACGCLDYFFYPPLFHFTLSDPQDWVALSAFEISALLVSRLSSSAQINSRDAKSQRMSMEHLYELSRSTLLINLHQPPGPQLAALIQRIFDAEAVAIFDGNSGESHYAGPWRTEESDIAKDCYLLQTDGEDRITRTSCKVLWAAGQPTGALAVRGQLSSLAINALASLTAITLDRCISFQKESKIEAAHQSERLRAAVLDSLAHAVKTPLTAIHTASAGLEEVGSLNEPQIELVSLIEDESNRLNQLTTRLLQTARLEADEMSISADRVTAEELISAVVKEQRPRIAGHPVKIDIPDPHLAIRGDRELMEMALVQYLDNAAKYSFANSAITITARQSHSEALFSVHNMGPAIPIAEREKVFQRFYRGIGTMHMAQGTGIGLSTVKMAAEAHHGHAWVISSPTEGTTFYLSLPKYEGGNSNG